MTGSPKIWDFKSLVPRVSWSSCSGAEEALGKRMIFPRSLFLSNLSESQDFQKATNLIRVLSHWLAFMTAVVCEIKTSYVHGQDNGKAKFIFFLLKRRNFVFTTKRTNNSLKAEEWGVGFSPDTEPYQISPLPEEEKK